MIRNTNAARRKVKSPLKTIKKTLEVQVGRPPYGSLAKFYPPTTSRIRCKENDDNNNFDFEVQRTKETKRKRRESLVTLKLWIFRSMFTSTFSTLSVNLETQLCATIMARWASLSRGTGGQLRPLSSVGRLNRCRVVGETMQSLPVRVETSIVFRRFERIPAFSRLLPSPVVRIFIDFSFHSTRENLSKRQTRVRKSATIETRLVFAPTSACNLQLSRSNVVDVSGNKAVASRAWEIDDDQSCLTVAQRFSFPTYWYDCRSRQFPTVTRSPSTVFRRYSVESETKKERKSRIA